MARRVDPITFTVVAGLIESTTREMTVILERTARSPILKVAHDFSNGLFDWTPRMIAQGERDSLSHLGSMIFMAKATTDYFGDEIYPGDIIYHNDPATGGGHLPAVALALEATTQKPRRYIKRASEYRRQSSGRKGKKGRT